MLRFLHYLFQFTVVLLVEELAIGILGIDKIIEGIIPGIAPYLHPWGTILLLFVGYVYLRLWMDKRQAHAPPKPGESIRDRIKSRWEKLPGKIRKGSDLGWKGAVHRGPRP